MLHTPLHQFHLDHHAKMVDFAGWEMPMLYTGIHEEHHQVRTSGGFFDVSHMGRVKFSGRHARRLLERLCSRRIGDMETGQCRYSLVCNERGGVRDDVIVYRMDEDEFLVVVNGANREKMLAHFEAVRSGAGGGGGGGDEFAAKIDDQTEKTAMVAIQGPKVMELVGKVSREVPSLKRYRFTVKNLMVVKLIVSRTGYTGEDGVEVILPAGTVGMAMKLFFAQSDLKGADAVVKPAGLGARDTLRLEAGMPLYGHELGEDINALACGVDFAISLDKDQHERGEKFIGQEALQKTKAEGGPPQRIVGIELDGKRTARQGNAVIVRGVAAGAVTSACLSPTLGKAIAMGLVDSVHAEAGSAVGVDTGRGVLEGRVVKLPFYKAPKA